MNHNKKIKTALQISRTRAIFGIIVCTLVFLSVCIGVVSNLVTDPTEEFPETGLKTFRMFTVDSNILAALSALLCIPFEIDGLRHRNTHLPRWIIMGLYMGVTGVAITLVTCLVLLAPFAGFDYIFLSLPHLMMHLVSPVLSILLFVFINSDKRLSWKSTLFSLIPLFLYFIVYYILVIVIGEENGGWRDHYGFTTYVPMIIPMLAVPLIGFGVSTLLRLSHNKVKATRDAAIERYYFASEEFALPTVEEAVANLAALERPHRRDNGDLYIPTRVIRMMMKKYHSICSMESLCRLYLTEYLK